METYLSEPLLWVSLAFVGLLALLYIKGRKPILDGLDNGIDKIRKELEDAESLNKEAAKRLAEAARRQSEADHEAKAILQQAEHDIKHMQEKAKQNQQAALERRRAQMQERIEQMQRAAAMQIQQEMADKALVMAKSLLSSHYANAKQDLAGDALSHIKQF